MTDFRRDTGSEAAQLKGEEGHSHTLMFVSMELEARKSPNG